jgi:copper(I)-binding protein
MTRALLLLAALLAAPAAAEPVSAGDLHLDRPQIREAPPGAAVAAGYLLVENRGEADDRLLGASSPVAEAVEIHEMAMEGDVMRMRPLAEGLEIPAGEAVSLEPGGVHLMLLSPEPLAAGEAHEITLRFERAGEVTLRFGVETLEAIREAVGGGHGGHG